MWTIAFSLALVLFVGRANVATAAAYDNAVVPNAERGEFRHGTYPSFGKRTHAGLDLVAPCGTPVHAFEDGRVIDVIDSEDNEHFDDLGYMVLIQHPAPTTDKPLATLYLHLQNPPLVRKNQEVKARTKIGDVGDTGFTFGCHLHFEVRHFLTRLHPVWKNIYAEGDQHASETFTNDWEDPEVFFAAQQTTKAKNDYLIKQKIDQEAGVVFRLIGRKDSDPCRRSFQHMSVFGKVPQSIDLSDDKKARKISERAKEFAISQCPKPFEQDVAVWLDTKAFENTSLKDAAVYDFYPIAGFNKRQGRTHINKLAAAVKTKRREAVSRLMFDEFVKHNVIVAWPKLKEFHINPFIYKDKIIGIKTKFRTMITQDQGLFRDQYGDILVSRLPTNLFLRQAHVLLAGKVIGKQVTKNPSGGEVLMPHLVFKGVHICEGITCEKILLWKK